MQQPICSSRRRAFGFACMLLAVLLAVAVATSGVTAQEKTLKDPLAADSRLLRNVTVSTEGIAIGDLIAMLAQRTGISLTAAREIADDKVIVFGPARPLRDLLADLAALFNNRWERRQRANGSVRYVLTRDVRAQQLENRLAQDRHNRLVARLEEYVRALAEPPDVLARRPEGDPIRACLSRPESRLGLAFFALLTTGQREQLFRRRHLDVSFQALTPEQQAPLRKLFTDMLDKWKAQAERDRASGGLTSPVPEPAQLEHGSLQFQWRQIVGQTNLQLELGRFPILVEAFFADATWLLPPRGNPYTGDPVPEDAPLPPLKALQERPGESAWPDRLRQLAQRTNVPLMADFYRSGPIARLIDPPRGSADGPSAALNALCGSAGYLWWVRGKTLLLRKRDWFAQRLKELPDRWVVAMADRLRSQSGRPSRGDVVRVLDLSLSQIAGMSDQVTPEDEMQLHGLRELLAIVAASPIGQRILLPGGDRSPSSQQTVVTADQMTPRQRLLVPAFLAAIGKPPAPNNDDGLSIEMWCPRGEPETTASGYRYVRVVVRGNASMYSLYLPMTLIDDRRATTKVEIAPKSAMPS
jgi:hypothetical protein